MEETTRDDEQQRVASIQAITNSLPKYRALFDEMAADPDRTDPYDLDANPNLRRGAEELLRLLRAS